MNSQRQNPSEPYPSPDSGKLRDHLHTALLACGAVLLVGSFAYAKPIFDYDESREWNRCRQERAIETRTNDHPMSAECRALIGRAPIGFGMAAGGILVLFAARKMKKKKAS